mmetsp:Transcript_68738/g.222085  ORF Transcript_68738/g.222085 Transcript_68738/m.222085 type:complete len:333 (-) Transcript_68738:532-1530(-)
MAHHQRSSLEGLQGILQELAREDVQVVRRLVQHQQGDRLQQELRKGHAGLLTTAEAADRLVLGDAVKPQPLEHRLEASRILNLTGAAAGVERVLDARGLVVEVLRQPLREVSQASTGVLHAAPHAGALAQVADNGPDQRALATAVPPDEGHLLAPGHVEGDAVQDDVVRVGDAQALDDEQWCIWRIAGAWARVGRLGPPMQGPGNVLLVPEVPHGCRRSIPACVHRFVQSAGEPEASDLVHHGLWHRVLQQLLQFLSLLCRRLQHKAFLKPADLFLQNCNCVHKPLVVAPLTSQGRIAPAHVVDVVTPVGACLPAVYLHDLCADLVQEVAVV